MKNILFYSKEILEYFQYIVPSFVIISSKNQNKLDSITIKNWLYSSDRSFILILFFFYLF
jgi:hypothetical protein